MQAIFHPQNMHLIFDPKGDPIRPWVVDGQHTFCSGVILFGIDNGFRTDLASVPLWLAWLCPPNGSHQRAAVHHDAAYQRQNCSRFTADAGFRVIMTHDGVPRWRRLLMFYAVRLFGGFAWRANAEAKQ